MEVTPVLDFCGHEIVWWWHLYKSDLEFDNTYQTLMEGKQVPNFHLHDALLCHMGHLYVRPIKHVKKNLEAHYNRVTRHFRVDKKWQCCKSIFIGQTFNTMLGSTSYPALPMPVSNQPSKSNAYILLRLLLNTLGNPSPWITCQTFLLLSMEMTAFSWSSTNSLICPFWQLARRASQWKPLLSSSLNRCGYTFGSHSPLSRNMTVGS